MGIERMSEFWPEWKIVKEIGEGGFGKVYKAVDEEAGFPAYSAIKVLSIPSSKAELDALRSEGMSESETKTYFREIVDSFVNEIKVMHTLKGAPNIVSVEGFKILEKQNSVGWDIFIRMELLTSFKDYIKNRTLNESEVVKIAADIANALEVCRSKNIIHRDIKPGNIFVDEFGNFKLGDFGIAKELEKSTGAVSSKGTFSYMAPEVARGKRYDPTVDIYSLGLVMYSLLNNNRPPFVDINAHEVGYNQRKAANDRRLSGAPLPPPCNASPQLASVILMACAYDPSARFKTPNAFKNALKAYKSAAPVDPIPPIADTATDEVPQKAKRKSKGTIIAAVMIAVLLLILVVSVPLMIKGFTGLMKKSEPETTVPETDGDIVMSFPNDTTTESQSAKYTETAESESTETHDNKESEKTPSVPAVTYVQVGDTVRFGNYEQDGNYSNGKETIDWIVLDKEGDKLLLISKYGLDGPSYNYEEVSTTWENSDLRSWLNLDFYNEAFSHSEKSRIETTYVENNSNYDYGTYAGNDTRDNIFCLDLDEANYYFSSDAARTCYPTKYALNQRVWENEYGQCWWWLRSPGNISTYAARVNAYGGVESFGRGVYVYGCAVRPVMWVTWE